MPNFEGKPEHEQLGLFLSNSYFIRKQDELTAFRFEEIKRAMLTDKVFGYKKILYLCRGMLSDKEMLQIKEGYKLEHKLIDRPDEVKKAIIILYSMLGIGIIRSILEASTTAQMVSPAFLLFITVFTFVFIWFFIYMIGKGKNWARITFLVLFVVGIPLSFLPLLQSIRINPVSGSLGIVQLILQILALVFLFQRPSSNWFKMTGALRSKKSDLGQGKIGNVSGNDV